MVARADRKFVELPVTRITTYALSLIRADERTMGLVVPRLGDSAATAWRNKQHDQPLLTCTSGFLITAKGTHGVNLAATITAALCLAIGQLVDESGSKGREAVE